MHKLLNSSFISLYSQKVSSGFNYSNFQFTNQFLWQNLPQDSQDDSWLMQEYQDWWCSRWSSLHGWPESSTHTCLLSWTQQPLLHWIESREEHAEVIQTWPRCPDNTEIIFTITLSWIYLICSSTSRTLVQRLCLQNVSLTQSHSLTWRLMIENYFTFAQKIQGVC